MTESGNARLLEEASAYTPGGVHTSIRIIDPPLCVRRAEGAYIEDVDGRRYIDYHAAFGPFILGHCYPDVVERVVAAIRQTDLYGVSTTELELALAKKVVEHVPSVEQVLLCCTGSEATFHAVRLARAVTGEVLDNTLVCDFNDLHAVERAVRDHPDDVAAIILEPIPHNLGCIMPRPAFLAGLRALCDREGIVLIFDEVITGFRHHIGGYQAICGVTPDLTTMGKAMANGFPMAAVGSRRELMQRFNTRPGGDVYFAGTFNAHASCVAASLATIDVLETGKVHEHIFRLGERMRAGLRDIVDRAGIPATVAGFGSVYVLYFMEDRPISNYTDLLRNNAPLFVRYRQELMKRGVFEMPMNLKRNHISYSHTDADVDQTLQAAEESLQAALAGCRAQR